MSDAVVKIQVTTPITLEELAAILAFAIEVDPAVTMEANYGSVTVSLWARDFVAALERLSVVVDA